MDPITRLEAGVDQARPIIAAIAKEDFELPTPCPEWNVRQLINHMIGALVMFRDVAVDGEADPSLFERDLVGDNPADSFDSASRSAIAAWREEGKLDGAAKLPFGEFPASFALQLPAMDMVVHGWDLARATGQQLAWDPDLVADTLTFCEATFTTPEFRGKDFAPPVAVPDDADDITRLVAFLGRNP